MTISPFFLLLALYSFANFVSLLFGVNDGGMLIEGAFFELSEESLIYAFLLQHLFLLILWLIYKIFYTARDPVRLQLGTRYGLFILMLQLFFLAYNQIQGVNVAGVESHGGGALDYLFILLAPDILFVMIALGLKSGKWFGLNCLVFLVSMMLRAWMGGILVVMVLMACRHTPIRVSSRALLRFSIALVLFSVLLPVLIEAKWAMRTGLSVSDFVEQMFAVGLGNYGEAVRYVMNRLQHVGHVALMIEHASQLHEAYLNGAFIPYWADGLPQMTIYKVMGLDYLRINTYLVNALLGYPDAYWNTNPGLAGWAALLQERAVMLFLYVIVLLATVYAFLRRFADSRYVMLIGCFSLIYLYHGWIGAFVNFCFYAVLLVFICRVRVLPRRRYVQSPGYPERRV
ncbi:oligosaccharide repeat unit polymerase [Pseudomonas putida]|uniref:oligosaccharide repeat unit polymerase n=1 Tax=Pseudomonas putida TaxID=303 RepID=UPI00383AAFAE